MNNFHFSGSKNHFSKAFLFVAVLLFFGLDVTGQTFSKEQIQQLKFRHIGPVGNRIISVTGDTNNPLLYYVGAASGGIWKTIDGGLNWTPVFDTMGVHAIGALALAPSDQETIYAGTGESFIRSNISLGNGIYKSMNGGETWVHAGLTESGRISRIIVHPENPDIVFAAALGHAYQPQSTRGIYKSIDGGVNWKQVLYINDSTGISDLVLDPINSRIMFAGAWQIDLKTWNRSSGGPGGGIFKSSDGGETWEKLEGNGLPEKPVGKIALAMTPAAPGRIYAAIETGDGVPLKGEITESGELWRSDDRGKTWTLINYNRDIGGRQAYYTRCAASPDNPNEVYFIAADFRKSIDGGRTLEKNDPNAQPNWDHHEMWIDPRNGDRMIVVGDGGLSISNNRGLSWLRVQLPVAQVYHVTTDKSIPYNVLTNRQDGPSMKGPSRSRTQSFVGGGITSGLWYDIGGGESGFATPDPENPDIIWSSASGYGPMGGIVTRFNENSKQFRQVEVWPDMTTGHTANEVKFRFQWTFPLLISPHDNNTVYVTSQFVHRTTNGGQSWDIISPDLTLNDSTKQGFSGGLTGDNINVEYFNVIYAFDESPVQQGVLWAGTNDGLVHVSQDGGINWTNVTENIPDLPKLGVVRNIEASKWDAGKAYITIEFHQIGNFEPFVYKTENFGRNWTKIVDGIDDHILSYTRHIKEDPTRQGLLYLGTENKLYISFNDGVKWQPFMSNLPNTPMYWFDIPEHFNDLVIGTYGRGIWILDDITPIQQMSPEILESDAYLFDHQPAYRFQPVSSNMQFFPDASTGQDPPFGTPINFWLGNDNDSVEIQILNMNGDTVRTLKHKGKSGINRVWWNFRSDLTDTIHLRTPPKFADWVPLSKKRTRMPDFAGFNYLLPPGDYQISLMVAGEQYLDTIAVLKDPNSEGSLEDISTQTALIEKIYQDMNEVAGMVNNIELVKRQLLDRKEIMMVSKPDSEILAASDSLYKRLETLESNLLQLKRTGTGQDIVRWPVKLAERLTYLASAIATADFPPTDQQLQVYQILNNELGNAKKSFNEILTGDYQEYIIQMSEANIGPIILKE